MKKIFENEGFVDRTDLENEKLKKVFLELEKIQDEHLENEKNFRSKEYKWPSKPLHSWSRIWEYPFVHYHIRKYIESLGTNVHIKVADVGSGVTFFPFSIARMGADVTCFDIDPIIETDIPKSLNTMSAAPGSINTCIIEPNKNYNIEDNTFDVVYCISVLEHIPNFESTINEIHRILKPNGIFILTIDIDLRGDYELGASAFDKLRNLLENKFDKYLEPNLTHPANLLTTYNSIYKWEKSLKKKLALNSINALAKTILKHQYTVEGQGEMLSLAIYANVLKK